MHRRKLHSRPRIRLKITLLALLAALSVPAGTHASSRAACSMKNSKTVLANKYARVFAILKEKPEPARPSPPHPVYEFFYGCLYATNKTSFLASGDCLDPWGDVAALRLAGRHVGYTRVRCDPHGLRGAIVTVLSLASGLKREWFSFEGLPPHSASCLPPCNGVLEDLSTWVTGLEIKANGSIAWIGRLQGLLSPTGGPSPQPYNQYQVRKTDASGENVLLDAAGDIDPSSLRLSPDGTTIYWTKGSTEYSAPLN